MRKLTDWLGEFERYTEILSSPLIYRRWAGIMIVAAALERKVWIETSVGTLYPNLYVFFVGPPAVGKTVPIALSARVIKSLPNHKVASSSITRATLIEELSEAQRFKSTPTGAVEFNSLFVASNEMGVIIPEYALEFLSKLTDLYDCHPYSERRRNAKHNADIKRPQVNMLVGTQPGYLANILPDVAWEQGFLSRVILIYAGEPVRKSLFSKTEADKVVWERLISDLKEISELWGEFRFTSEVKSLIDDFYLIGHKRTALLHPKLQNYNTRRPTHLLKLMQIASAMESSDLVIDVHHFQQAMDWLTEAEHIMPQVFKAMTTGGDSSIIKDLWYYVYRVNGETGKSVPEERIVAYLGQRVPVEKIKWILDIMKSSGLLKAEFTSAGPQYLAAGDPSSSS